MTSERLLNMFIPPKQTFILYPPKQISGYAPCLTINHTRPHQTPLDHVDGFSSVVSGRPGSSRILVDSPSKK